MVFRALEFLFDRDKPLLSAAMFQNQPDARLRLRALARDAQSRATRGDIPKLGVEFPVQAFAAKQIPESDKHGLLSTSTPL